METEKKMDMEQFAKKIKEMLEQQGQYEVELKQVLKNNGVIRCGLMLRSGEDNLAPKIYIEPFFEAYKDGVDMEEIVEKILEVYESAPSQGVDMSFFQNFATVRDRLCMKLVNREANVELLSAVPHRGFLNMAVIYYVDYYNPRIGAGTIQVYNTHMEMWDVTEEDLWEVACINTPIQKPGRIESMRDILAETFARQENGDSECRSCTVKSPMPMLVITNSDRVNGAAVVLYRGMLKQAAEKVGSDLFILPSSLHEVIAVPVMDEKEATGLREIVMEVNKQLRAEEILSDQIYVYKRAQDMLEIA